MRGTNADTYVREAHVRSLDYLAAVPFQTPAAGPVFAARSMGFKAILEDYMPVRITRHDKKTNSMQPADESIVMVGGRLVAISTYTGRKSNLRILRGSSNVRVQRYQGR